MALQDIGQQRGFASAETSLALHRENGRDRGAGVLFQPSVEVHEVEPEADRQAPPDGTLAGAHGPDQHEVGRGIHAPMLASTRMDPCPIEPAC